MSCFQFGRYFEPRDILTAAQVTDVFQCQEECRNKAKSACKSFLFDRETLACSMLATKFSFDSNYNVQSSDISTSVFGPDYCTEQDYFGYYYDRYSHLDTGGFFDYIYDPRGRR